MKHQPSDEVQIFINRIFTNIEDSKTLKELREIEKYIGEKYKINTGKYPKINFDISKDEIAELIKEEILVHSSEGYFLKDEAINELPPIARLLYSVLWKNGDLRKLNHIIQGISEGDEETRKVDGLVFYQFGKFLANKSEPVIDQHVIRAFAVYRPINNESVDELRKIDVINKKHLNYIRNYKDWFSQLPNQIRQIPEASYYIDKLLFAAGKSIKL